MDQKLDGYRTLAIETAKEMGIDLMTGITVNTPLYDKWAFVDHAGFIPDNTYPSGIIYFTESGLKLREIVKWESFNWPLSHEDREKYKQRVRDTIKTLQQVRERF
jgi:hypothetical protein